MAKRQGITSLAFCYCQKLCLCFPAGGQNIVGEVVAGNVAVLRALAGNHCNQAQLRDSKNVLPPSPKGIVTIVPVKLPYPPLEAVLASAVPCAAALHLGGFRCPLGRDNLLPVLNAAVEEQLPKPCAVPCGHNHAVAAVGDALGVCPPNNAIHAQRLKKLFLCVICQGPAGGVFQRRCQQVGVASAVIKQCSRLLE